MGGIRQAACVLQWGIHSDAEHPDGVGALEKFSAKSSFSGAFLCLGHVGPAAVNAAYPTLLATGNLVAKAPSIKPRLSFP